MQVVCGNCQLSFQAPDGATGLVCPICRSPLRAPDAPAEADSGPVHQMVDWSGGTLDDLVSLLSPPAWSARVEVLPTNGGNAVGEVHVIAGGVSEAIYEGRSTHDALDKLRAVKNTRFRIEPRLPNPSDGDLTFPGPDQGKLEERPLAHLMRYCEDYVLTAGIEVWRGSENAKVDYRRGEIVGVTVGGIDAPERLAEVMKWSSGSYRLRVPRLSLPETAPKAAVPVAVVGSRSSGAASKTIFGMPALDPATLADKVKTPQGPAASGVKATTLGMARTITPVNAAANNAHTAPSTMTPTAPPTAASAPEMAAATSAPPQTSHVAKTMFGVQAPVMAPTPSAPAAAGPSKPASAPASTAAAPSKPASAPATTAPASESAKPSRTAAPAASARAPMAPTMAAADADRTSRTHKETQKNPQAAATTGETPVWTYVGVGFVFGLALLGVYRLVIVLAH